MARYQAGLKTQRKILDATRDLLSEAGLEGTTIKAICDRAGVQAGSFYNLFPSKEEAVLSVVKEAITAVGPGEERAGTERPEDLVAAYIEFITGQSALARVYLQIAILGSLTETALSGRVLHHHEERVRRFTEAVARGGDLSWDEAKLRAELMLATLNGLAFMWLVEPGFDFRGHAQRLITEKVS